jgi:hypothetical protein
MLQDGKKGENYVGWVTNHLTLCAITQFQKNGIKVCGAVKTLLRIS